MIERLRFRGLEKWKHDPCELLFLPHTDRTMIHLLKRKVRKEVYMGKERSNFEFFDPSRKLHWIYLLVSVSCWGHQTWGPESVELSGRDVDRPAYILWGLQYREMRKIHLSIWLPPEKLVQNTVIIGGPPFVRVICTFKLVFYSNFPRYPHTIIYEITGLARPKSIARAAAIGALPDEREYEKRAG